MRTMLKIARTGAGARVVDYVALGWLLAMVAATAVNGLGQG